jgi:predicted DnaQ family exonuclease/DinG family helicase
VRLTVDGAGTITPADRFVTFVDPGRGLARAITRLTGIADADLAGAPSLEDAMARLVHFLGEDATLVGHNVGFDVAFLERAGLPPGVQRLDTVELASILLPTAPSYALQRLAADGSIVPEAAHRAVHDALTCASVLSALALRARSLPPLVLEECAAQASLLGPAYAAFFERALRSSFDGGAGLLLTPPRSVIQLGQAELGGTEAGTTISAWPQRSLREEGVSRRPAPPPGVGREDGAKPISARPSDVAAEPISARAGDVVGAKEGSRRGSGGAPAGAVSGARDVAGEANPKARALRSPAGASPARALTSFALLAEHMPGYEERPEQVELATAIESTFETGGVLVAEAGTGIGKSLAYLVPALRRAAMGERVVVSTHTLPLQDQLVRKDLPALQEALGTSIPVATLKGRSNYLCPRRWQIFRTSVGTRDEARLALKTLVWRSTTETGDRAEINLMGSEGALWPRISADDETCDRARCGRVAGGCYLENARERAARSGIVVVNHALLLYDARMRSALLPESAHAVVDEAHHLEDVASDVFGYRLEDQRLRHDLDRVARSPLVIAALRDDRAPHAEALRQEIQRARELAGETFAALAALLPAEGAEDRLRITRAVRASDDRWLPVELAAERLADALGAVLTDCDRVEERATLEEDDIREELAGAAVEIMGTRLAISRGVHDPRPNDIVWLAAQPDGAIGLYVAPEHVGPTLRRALIERYRSVVMTSATLAVAGSLGFTLERLGIRDVASTLILGSSFDHAGRSVLIVPNDVAYPSDAAFAADVAMTVEEIARAIGGRTLVLFTSHAAMRKVAALLDPLEDEGLAVLTQGLGGSRRAIVERFVQGSAVLLGTQSFWEGVDLPGDLLRCVVIAKLPFAVPDDPLVAGRSERYDDPFREFQLPQAALRLRQGFGRLLRTRTDRGAVVLMDRRVVERDYGPTFIASLPDVRVRRIPREAISAAVAEATAD